MARHREYFSSRSAVRQTFQYHLTATSASYTRFLNQTSADQQSIHLYPIHSPQRRWSFQRCRSLPSSWSQPPFPLFWPHPPPVPSQSPRTSPHVHFPQDGFQEIIGETTAPFWTLTWTQSTGLVPPPGTSNSVPTITHPQPISGGSFFPANRPEGVPEGSWTTSADDVVLSVLGGVPGWERKGQRLCFISRRRCFALRTISLLLSTRRATEQSRTWIANLRIRLMEVMLASICRLRGMASESWEERVWYLLCSKQRFNFPNGCSEGEFMFLLWYECIIIELDSLSWWDFTFGKMRELRYWFVSREDYTDWSNTMQPKFVSIAHGILPNRLSEPTII